MLVVCVARVIAAVLMGTQIWQQVQVELLGQLPAPERAKRHVPPVASRWGYIYPSTKCDAGRCGGSRGGRGGASRRGIQNGRRFGRDIFTVCNVSPTSPPLCHTTPPISRRPLPARGPRLFVSGCLDAWLTASNEQATSDITCCRFHRNKDRNASL